MERRNGRSAQSPRPDSRANTSDGDGRHRLPRTHDTSGEEKAYAVNPEGLNALLELVLGLATRWAEKPNLKVGNWSGPQNALPANHIELARGRSETECAVRLFVGRVELTFLIPVDDVMHAAL
jgi:hypothetical protein